MYFSAISFWCRPRPFKPTLSDLCKNYKNLNCVCQQFLTFFILFLTCTLVWLAPSLFKHSSKILYSLHYSFHPILFHFHLISYLNMSCFLSAFTNQTNGDQFLVLKYQFNVKFISASAPSKAGHHSQVV